MNKRKILNVFIVTLVLITAIIGLIKVNLVNSKTLSPLNKNYDNYDIEEKEIFNNYSDFINDNTLIKLYKEKSGDILIKIKNSKYIIRHNLSMKDAMKNIFNKIEELF